MLFRSLSLGIDDRKGPRACDATHDYAIAGAEREVASWVDWLYGQRARDVDILGFSRGGAQVAAMGPALPTVRRVVLVAPSFAISSEIAHAYEKAYAHPLAPALAEARKDPLKKLTVDFLADYSRAVALHTRPFPHVVDSLERFARAGIAMGVCTSKAGALTRQLLAELDLTRHFAAVAGGDDVPARKPDPSHVMHVLERMGVNADDAIYVGDSETDVKTARAANLPVILVTFGYTPVPPRELGADAVIDSFSELPALVQV